MPRRRVSKPASSKPTEAKKNASESVTSETAAVGTKFEKQIGISSESLKKIFTSDTPNDQVVKLKDMLHARVKDGRRMSLRDWRVHAAIDEAYRAPFNQISPTLIGKIMAGDRRLTAEEILKELERWGLSENTLFTTLPNPKDPKQTIKILNRETFHKILVPLVKACLDARESKLFTERCNNPFFVYSPNKQTEEYKAIGDIITQVVEMMTTAYGFKAVLRAVIHNALKYSFAMAFPAEAWHFEETTGEDGKDFTKNEGLRYNIPHPTNCFVDQNHRPGTVNTDTGVEWGGYWKLDRFGDIDANPMFYNKDKITYGGCCFGGNYSTYFESAYPCLMKFPCETFSAWNDSKREDNAAKLYSTADNDKAVFLTNLFCKLSPEQWGLGKYKHKIWFRFVMASDSTVVFAEPMPYCPMLYLGTSADDTTSSSTASFALEVLPWQDLVGNLLSQHLLSVKQNCIKVIPYDKTQVSETDIKMMEATSKESQAIIWFPYDPREARVSQVDTNKMFAPVTFPQVDTSQIINTISQVFNIMERALGISAQEVGAIAGHIQTAEEIRTVSGNQSTRLEFLGTFIDEFIDAWKRQIYHASQAFMDDEFAVYIAGVDEKIIKKLTDDFGFEFGEPFNGKVEVTGSKKALSVDAFISSREGNTRMQQPQVAQVMMQTIQAVAANPELAAKVGAEQIVKLLNRAAILAGAPEDSGFKIMPEATAVAELNAIQAQLQQFAKQIADAATQQATAEVGKQVAPALQKLGEATQQAGATAQQAGQAAQAAGQGVQAAGQAIAKDRQTLEQLAAQVIKISQFIQAAMQAPPEPSQTEPVNGPVQLAA